MTMTLSNKVIGTAFTRVIEQADRDKLDNILFNWSEVEYDEDHDRLITYPGRDACFSRGVDGGKSYVTKKSFFEWLYSEAPFDTKIYGESILEDKDWAKDIQDIRAVAGLTSIESK